MLVGTRNTPLSRAAAVAWFLFLLLAASPGAVAAQQQAQAPASNKQDEAAYQRAIQHGLQEFNLGHFPEARTAFTRAHELSPNARTYRALGMVAFEMRHYRESIAHLEAALASNVRPLTGQLESHAREVLARARGFVASVRLEVAPSSSEVRVDGAVLERTQDQPLLLEVGDHVIEARAEGFLPERRPLTVVGGEALKIALELRPTEVEPASTSEAQPPPLQEAAQVDRPGKRPWYKSPWFWTCAAVVVAGAGVGLGFGLRPESRTEIAESVGTSNTPIGGVMTLGGR